MQTSANRTNSQQAPAEGDIVIVDLNPVAGHEQGGKRPVLVISPYTYNERVGVAVVVPLTTRIKNYPFEVPLGKATPEPTVALADCVRNIDWRARNAVKRGQVDSETLTQVRSKLRVVLGIR